MKLIKRFKTLGKESMNGCTDGGIFLVNAGERISVLQNCCHFSLNDGIGNYSPRNNTVSFYKPTLAGAIFSLMWYQNNCQAFVSVREVLDQNRILAPGKPALLQNSYLTQMLTRVVEDKPFRDVLGIKPIHFDIEGWGFDPLEFVIAYEDEFVIPVFSTSFCTVKMADFPTIMNNLH